MVGRVGQENIRRFRQSALPSLLAASKIHGRTSAIGVAPVTPPQPGFPLTFVPQLTTPTSTSPFFVASKTGPPESPLQAPPPRLSPRVAGSTSRICRFV